MYIYLDNCGYVYIHTTNGVVEMSNSCSEIIL